MTVSSPPVLTEALDTLTAAGGGALFFAWSLPRPLLLIGLGAERLHGRGRLPVLVSAALAVTASGPVVRMQFTLYDDPTRPFLAECFVNVAEECELRALQCIAREQRLAVVAFRGHTVERMLTVGVGMRTRPALRDLVAVATRALYRMTPPQLDWARARAAADRAFRNLYVH